MNFMIVVNTNTYSLWHGIAVQLKSLYPESRFAAIILGHGNIKGVLEKQEDVKYEYVYEITHIERKFLNEEVPYKVLREFEATIPEKSLWRFIAIDRKWGYQFSKGAIPVSLVPKKEIHCENILKVAGGYVKYFKDILAGFNTNVVIFRMGMHSLVAPILEQVCKNMNIIHITPVETRIQNYFSLTPVKEYLFPQINSTYKKIMEGQLPMDLSPGKKCYEEMLCSIEKKNSSYYFDQGNINIKRIEQRVKHCSIIVVSLRGIVGRTIDWFRYRKLDKNKLSEDKMLSEETSRYTIKSLFYSYYYSLYKSYQMKKLFNKNFIDEYDPEEKYLYFPLNAVPEYTIQVQANMWINQLHIIETLAKSIPFDWKVYVKEHPSQVAGRARTCSFYKEIKSYSNVKFIPFETDGHQIIKNSQIVVNITGTTGWEAILFHGKPVITFAESTYEICKLSKRVSCLTELSREINKECKRIKNISPEERRKRLVCFLNAVLLHSCWVDNPLTITGDEECTLEEGKITGKIIGDTIKKYLNDQ